MRVALVFLVALALAGVASAAPPGFTEAPALEPAASFVAGKPVKVWCGVTMIGDAFESGYAQVGGADIYVMPTLVCAPLRQTLQGARASSFDFGSALLVLLHEAAHTSGVRDERTADCVALARVSQVGILYFGLRGQRRFLHDTADAAWSQHRSAPAPYSGAC